MRTSNHRPSAASVLATLAMTFLGGCSNRGDSTGSNAAPTPSSKSADWSVVNVYSPPSSWPRTYGTTAAITRSRVLLVSQSTLGIVTPGSTDCYFTPSGVTVESPRRAVVQLHPAVAGCVDSSVLHLVVVRLKGAQLSEAGPVHVKLVYPGNHSGNYVAQRVPVTA